MANYTILHQQVQASSTAGTNSVVVFEPSPLLTATANGQPSAYFQQGQVVSDTNLGGGTPVARLLALGAIG